MTESFNWAMIYPEILLLLMACVISLADLSIDHLKSPGRTLTYLLSVSTLAVVAVIAAVNAASGEVGFAFNNMVVYDPLGNWLKSFASIAMIVTFVYGRPYSMDRGMPVSYTHLRAHETVLDLVCRLLLEKKKK